MEKPSELIRAAMAREGVGPTDASDLLGISKGHAGDLMSGRRNPTPELALKLEERFGIAADLLNPTIARARGFSADIGEEAA